MANFFVTYPEMISAFFTGAACVIGSLLSVIVYLAKGSIDRLNATIQKVIKKTEQTDKEIKELDLRLSEQETICDICRKSCPLREGISTHDRRKTDNHGEE